MIVAWFLYLTIHTTPDDYSSLRKRFATQEACELELARLRTLPNVRVDGHCVPREVVR